LLTPLSEKKRKIRWVYSWIYSKYTTIRASEHWCRNPS